MPDGRPHSRVENVGGGSGHVSSGGPVGGGFGGSGGGGPRAGGTRAGGVGILGGIVVLIISIIGSCLGLTNDVDSNYTAPSSSYMTYSNNATYTNTDDSAVDTAVSSSARSKYTSIKGGGADKVTLMLYVIGTDLESDNGMATADINEILHADLANDNLNVIIQTGGCKSWRNSVMSKSNIERWQASSKGLTKLDSQKITSMSEPSTLSSFIQFAAKQAPADRYMLILWDHGGGSVTGYGYDQYYPKDTMNTSEIAQALKAGGVKFDFVGFDACLMATLENAISIEPYADYLIASEESEPGTGWYYTNWVSDLSANTSTPTLDLAKTILDDYTSRSTSSGMFMSYGTQTTLSVTDLAELHGTVPEALTNFGTELNDTLTSNDYQSVATARSAAKEFSSSSRLDQVDLVDFCKKLDTSEANALADVVQNAVKYNRVKGVTDAYGLSLYFPNSNLSYMNEMSEIYDDIDMDSAFVGSVRQYATLEASGQIVSNNTGTTLFDLLTGGQYSSGSTGSYGSGYGTQYGSGYGSGYGGYTPSYGGYSSYGGSYSANDLYNMLTGSTSGSTGYYTTGGAQYGATDYQSIFGGRAASWMTDNMIRVAASSLSNRALAPNADFQTVSKDGHDVLSLTGSQWAEIAAAEVNVFVPDENNGGWLDLGLDNTGKYNADGDLIDEWTGNWITLNGNFAAMYPVSDLDEDGDGKYITTKYIPATLNGDRVNIIVEFNEETGKDTVLGADPVYEVDTESKGLTEIKSGDKIQLLCDHYTDDGSVKEEYKLGSAFTVGDSGLKLYSLKVDNSGCIFSYRLTDIYGAFHWLPLKTN